MDYMVGLVDYSGADVTFKGAAIAVVEAIGDFNVVLISHAVVSRVKAYPAYVWDECF